MIEAALARPIISSRHGPDATADVIYRMPASFNAWRHSSWKAVGMAGLHDDGGLQAVAHRIAAGHQCCAGRRAEGLRGKLLELQPLGGELVDIRGLDVRAVKADVLPAQIVGDDVDDVRLIASATAGFSDAASATLRRAKGKISISFRPHIAPRQTGPAGPEGRPLASSLEMTPVIMRQGHWRMPAGAFLKRDHRPRVAAERHAGRRTLVENALLVFAERAWKQPRSSTT